MTRPVQQPATARMQLTFAERHAIINRLPPRTGYLIRLVKKMQQLGWSEEDPAYQRARQAHEALVDLSMALTYAGTSLSWEPPKERRCATSFRDLHGLGQQCLRRLGHP
jgi:hypothetical protein